MPKILIIDDSVEIRDKLYKFLTDSGFEVISGINGEDGLEKAKANDDLDIILSDYHMPKLNGLEMCEQIKQLEKHKSTPIVMLTTEGSKKLRADGRNMGVLAWIIKPFSPNGILDIINDVIDNKIELNEMGMVTRETSGYNSSKDNLSIQQKLLALEEENRLLKSQLQTKLLKTSSPLSKFFGFFRKK